MQSSGGFLCLQNQFSEIKVSYSEVEQWNMIVFIIVVQSTDRFYAPFSIKSVENISPQTTQQYTSIIFGILSEGQLAKKKSFTLNRKWDGSFFLSQSGYNFQHL